MEPKYSGLRLARRIAGTFLLLGALIVLAWATMGSVYIIGCPRQPDAATRAQIDQLEKMLSRYHTRNDRYPSTEEGFAEIARFNQRAGLINAVRIHGGLLDPWKNVYQYRAPGTPNLAGYEIWSFGADGKPGGTGLDADIGSRHRDRASVLKTELTRARALWMARKPNNYTLRFQRQCSCLATELVDIHVEDGTVVAVEAVDHERQAYVDDSIESYQFNVERLFDAIGRRIELSGDAKVLYDRRTGYPMYVSDVGSRVVADDEVTIRTVLRRW